MLFLGKWHNDIWGEIFALSLLMFLRRWSEEMHSHHRDSRAWRRLLRHLQPFVFLKPVKCIFFAYNICPMLPPGILLLLSFSWSFVSVLRCFWKSTTMVPFLGGVTHDECFGHRLEASCEFSFGHDSLPAIPFENLVASWCLACIGDIVGVTATLESSSIARWSSSGQWQLCFRLNQN